jgi:hypothetical protein
MQVVVPWQWLRTKRTKSCPGGAPDGLRHRKGLEVQFTVNGTPSENSTGLFAVPDESGAREPGSMSWLVSGFALEGWRVCGQRRAL